MGIDGLLKLLKPITQKEHISSFKNQTIGIDMMPWIYRGCYSCNFQLSQNMESIKFLYYILQMIEVLGYYNIKPIFVIDGRSIHMKEETNEKRNREKLENKQRGLKYLKQGKIEEARKYLSRCIFIDERIISKTIDVLFSKNIQFIVAPYEADCQLAKLRNLGLIQAAISQDSDLLAYGINTILKLNPNGDCDYVDLSKWRPRDVDSQFLKQYLSMDMTTRIQAAILAGTDYKSSIHGIGIKRGVRNLYRLGNLNNVVKKLRNQKAYIQKIPQDYQKLAQKVKMIFLFAKVYNPIKKTFEYLHQDLLETHKPQNITLQQLDSIVGKSYPQYFEMQVYNGKTQAKQLKRRDIKAVNIRQLFTVNKQQMIMYESYNKTRKQQLKVLKESRQQQINEGMVHDDTPKYQQKKPIQKVQAQLTEQEKQKKKIERKNRIVKLQEVMNSVVELCEQEEQENQKKETLSVQQQQKISAGHFKLQKMMNELSQSEQYEENQQNLEEQSIQQSQSMDLAHLNPFAKKNHEINTAIKQDNIQKVKK